MEYTLPPYTLEERNREVQMRMKALYPYNDTSRTYASNTRIYGGAKGRFHLSTATAKPRFYVGRFGQHTQVTL
jgi:hypothetical protein